WPRLRILSRRHTSSGVATRSGASHASTTRRRRPCAGPTTSRPRGSGRASGCRFRPTDLDPLAEAVDQPDPRHARQIGARDGAFGDLTAVYQHLPVDAGQKPGVYRRRHQLAVEFDDDVADGELGDFAALVP